VRSFLWEARVLLELGVDASPALRLDAAFAELAQAI
jgi:hypothetical protein